MIAVKFIIKFGLMQIVLLMMVYIIIIKYNV